MAAKRNPTVMVKKSNRTGTYRVHVLGLKDKTLPVAEGKTEASALKAFQKWLAKVTKEAT